MAAVTLEPPSAWACRRRRQQAAKARRPPRPVGKRWGRCGPRWPALAAVPCSREACDREKGSHTSRGLPPAGEVPSRRELREPCRQRLALPLRGLPLLVSVTAAPFAVDVGVQTAEPEELDGGDDIASP